MRDRFNTDQGVAAVLCDSRVHLIYSYYDRNAVFDALHGIIPASHLTMNTISGGNFVPAMNGNVQGHSRHATFLATDEQIIALADALDRMRESKALFLSGR